MLQTGIPRFFLNSDEIGSVPILVEGVYAAEQSSLSFLLLDNLKPVYHIFCLVWTDLTMLARFLLTAADLRFLLAVPLVHQFHQILEFFPQEGVQFVLASDLHAQLLDFLMVGLGLLLEQVLAVAAHCSHCLGRFLFYGVESCLNEARERFFSMALRLSERL